MQGRHIRNAVRAILIEDGKILLCKYIDKKGEFFACIGGGQDPFEDMHTALRRECREEINHEIKIGDLAFVREAIFDNDDGSEKTETIHQIEYFFLCTLVENQAVYEGNHPDANALGIEWVSFDRLKDIRVYPAVFNDFLNVDGTLRTTVYLGMND